MLRYALVARGAEVLCEAGGAATPKEELEGARRVALDCLAQVRRPGNGTQPPDPRPATPGARGPGPGAL